MLSTNYIATFLDKNQKKIKNKNYVFLKDFEYKKEYEEKIKSKISIFKNESKESYKDIYESMTEYFESEYFGFLKESNKNKNIIYSFFSSILTIGDENYLLMKEDEKLKSIKNIIHIMDNDLLNKNYYNELKYDKNKFFSKEKILTNLKESFNLRFDENFILTQKYVCDYLGINIVIFELKNKEIIDKYIIYSNKYTDNNNIYLPYYYIVVENNEYIPIMIKNKDFINYSLNDDKYKIINMLSKFKTHKISENLSEDYTKIKKMNIEDLRKYCIENDINIYKKSEKTGKEIKKKKDELLNEIIF